MLVAGETAIGKSTLINTLLHRNLNDVPHPHHDSAADIEAFTYDLEEGGVKLKLSVADQKKEYRIGAACVLSVQSRTCRLPRHVQSLLGVFIHCR